MIAATRPHPGITLETDDPAAEAAAQTALFGFWIFMMSDAIVFALLFATYGAMLGATAGGPTAAGLYRMSSTAIETLLLLTSSLTFAMGSLAMKYGDPPRRLLGWMGVTLVLGLAFLGMEARDVAGMFAAGAYPSRSGFLSAFFALVPLHGCHVVAAVVWMAVMMVQVVVLGLDRRVKINLMRLALFWHFLDIIWIAVFSVVYLQGMIR